MRRSAHILPSPLQNVVSVKRSAKRGKRVTSSRVRRTTHTALSREPGVLDVGVGDVLEPARERVEPDPPGRGAVGETGAHRECVLPTAVGGATNSVIG